VGQAFSHRSDIVSVEENVQLMRRWFKEVLNEGRTQLFTISLS
jgi:hypothetical protein